MAQAGIELLTWLTLVHDGLISEPGFEKLSAADQLRMALSLESVQVFRRLFRLVLSRRDDLRIVTILRLELLGREVVQLAM